MPELNSNPMLSPYTTTITNEALRRGIMVRVINPSVPIFELCHGSSTIRCYRSLSDRVGAVTFHLTQNKYLAGCFLRERGFPVPAQELYATFNQALDFLEQHSPIVVKPCMQWGARGVATNITTQHDLKTALKNARRFEPDILLEKMVTGDDYRLVFINYRFVSALQRRPARVIGNGSSTVRKLIAAQNRRSTAIDPVHRIPLDRETERFLHTTGFSFESIPDAGQTVTVRQTANYHTGGSVHDITGQVSADLIDLGKRIVKAAGLPVAGIDCMRSKDGQQTHVIELAPDLAISPRGGQRIAEHFIDYLFPETAGMHTKPAD
jgi:D-alanine-D-alanine ligase-like ATP-grasp enzyme